MEKTCCISTAEIIHDAEENSHFLKITQNSHCFRTHNLFNNEISNYKTLKHVVQIFNTAVYNVKA